jgi:hypothetical protein
MAVCIHGALLEKESWWAPQQRSRSLQRKRFASGKAARPGLQLYGFGIHDLLLHHDLALRSSSTPRPPRRQQAASLGRYLSSQSWRETDAGLDNRIDSGCRQPLPVALRLHVRPTCRPRTQSMRMRRAAGARCHGDSVVRRFYLLGCSRIVHYSWLPRRSLGCASFSLLW